jgi:hypothetical protein
MPSPLVAVAVDAIVALAIIAAASVLLALHDLTEATAIALFTTAVAVIGGSTKALLALKVPPPDSG